MVTAVEHVQVTYPAVLGLKPPIGLGTPFIAPLSVVLSPKQTLSAPFGVKTAPRSGERHPVSLAAGSKKCGGSYLDKLDGGHR